jgi:hypothetical protein
VIALQQKLLEALNRAEAFLTENEALLADVISPIARRNLSSARARLAEQASQGSNARGLVADVTIPFLMDYAGESKNFGSSFTNV